MSMGAELPTFGVLAQRSVDKWRWDLAWEVLPDLLRGLWVTVQLTLVSLAVAMVVGLVLALLRRSRLRIVRWPVGFFVEFVRSTPLLVQLFFLFFALPELPGNFTLKPFTAAVVGLGLHYACYTSESYRAGIESVERGQWEASTALNLSSIDTWGSVILPQAIPTAIPALGNYLVAAFKDAPLASTITVMGILAAADAFRSDVFRGVEAFTLTGLLFLAVSIPMATFARYLERRYGYRRD